MTRNVDWEWAIYVIHGAYSEDLESFCTLIKKPELRELTTISEKLSEILEELVDESVPLENNPAAQTLLKLAERELARRSV